MARAVACAVALLVALTMTSAARADADPASDTLYQHRLFKPYYPPVTPRIEAQLLSAIRDSVAARKEVRVALLMSANDLGGIPSMFGKPAQYARFLDTELQFVYRGRVLVVMPQGAGLAKNGRLIADHAVLATRPGRDADGLARTATELVREIAGLPPASTTSRSPPKAPLPSNASAKAARRKSDTFSNAPKTPKGVPVATATGIAVGIVTVLLLIGGLVVARRRRSLWE